MSRSAGMLGFLSFSLRSLLHEHDLLAKGADGCVLLGPPEHSFDERIRGQSLADLES